MKSYTQRKKRTPTGIKPVSDILFEGKLMKKGEKHTAWKERWIIMRQKFGEIKIEYYDISNKNKTLKGTIHGSNIHGIQILTQFNLAEMKEKLPPNICISTKTHKKDEDYAFMLVTPGRDYVFNALDSKDFFKWINLIHKYALHRIIEQGWLYKRGESKSSSFKLRYFVLTDRKELKYYEDSEMLKFKGSISLNNVQKVSECGNNLRKSNFNFELYTKERIWVLRASSENERKSWMHLIQRSNSSVSLELQNDNPIYVSLNTANDDNDEHDDGDGDSDDDHKYSQQLQRAASITDKRTPCQIEFVQFLEEHIGLNGQYPDLYERFANHKYDDIRFVLGLNAKILKSEIGLKELHVTHFLKQVAGFKAEVIIFREWLKRIADQNNEYAMMLTLNYKFETKGILTFDTLFRYVLNVESLKEMIGNKFNADIAQIVWNEMVKQQRSLFQSTTPSAKCSFQFETPQGPEPDAKEGASQYNPTNYV